MRVFPGAHVLSRDYHINHFTTPENAESIQKSGLLKPGPGHKGFGIYLTLMSPSKGFSLEEIKIAVRHEKLPDNMVARFVRLDTDDLDRRGIEYKKFGNTVFIETKKALNINELGGEVLPNPLVDE